VNRTLTRLRIPVESRQTGTKTEVHCEPIGVTFLTEDHAELLVNMVVAVTKDGVAQQHAAGPVLVRTEQVDGRWLAGDLPDS
jgi:Mce-associated membrane protein